jgi:hypothetical protein
LDSFSIVDNVDSDATRDMRPIALYKRQNGRGNKGDWLGMADPQESAARLFPFGRKVNTAEGDPRRNNTRL